MKWTTRPLVALARNGASFVHRHFELGKFCQGCASLLGDCRAPTPNLFGTCEFQIHMD